MLLLLFVHHPKPRHRENKNNFLNVKRNVLLFLSVIDGVCAFASPAGYYTHVSTLADVQENVMEYLHVLSRPMVINHDHDIIWTEAYMDSVVSVPLLLSVCLPSMHTIRSHLSCIYDNENVRQIRETGNITYATLDLLYWLFSGGQHKICSAFCKYSDLLISVPLSMVLKHFTSSHPFNQDNHTSTIELQ